MTPGCWRFVSMPLLLFAAKFDAEQDDVSVCITDEVTAFASLQD